MPESRVKAHRFLAAGLGVFIVSHLLIHLSAAFGASFHTAILSAVQGLYRNPIIEPVLILAIIIQIAIGAQLVLRRARQAGKTSWGWAQIISGLYLALFLIVHSSAALTTRYWAGIETDFYWAAETLRTAPGKYIFAPYYALGVTSVFVHLAAALHFGGAGKRVTAGLITLGIITAGVIVASFAGVFYEIEFPVKG